MAGWYALLLSIVGATTVGVTIAQNVFLCVYILQTKSELPVISLGLFYSGWTNGVRVTCPGLYMTDMHYSERGDGWNMSNILCVRLILIAPMYVCPQMSFSNCCCREGLASLEASEQRAYSYTLLMLATLPNKTRNKKLHNTLLIALTKVTPARLPRNKLTSD